MFDYFSLPINVRLQILTYCKCNIVNILLLDKELEEYCISTNWLANQLQTVSRIVNNLYQERYTVIEGTHIKHGMYKKVHKINKSNTKVSYFFGKKQGMSYKKNDKKKIVKYYDINRLVYKSTSL